MEELKANHETELQSVKNRYRKEKSSANAAISDQLSTLEKELEEQWTTKSERMVLQAEDKWRRKYRDLEVRIVYFETR